MNDPGYQETSISHSKRKFRNLNEKRRRDQFNILLTQLGKMVSNSYYYSDSRMYGCKMDKTTVLKSTISFLRNHRSRIENIRKEGNKINDVVDDEEEEDEDVVEVHWKPPFVFTTDFDQLMFESIYSILFIIDPSSNASILYSSDSITPLLSYLPSKLTDTSLLHLIRSDDRSRLNNLISSSYSSSSSSSLPSSSSESLLINCQFQMQRGDDTTRYETVKVTDTSFKHWKNRNVLVMGVTIISNRYLSISTIRETSVSIKSLKSFEFECRYSMEWKILYLDIRGSSILGYMPFELLGTSGYDYYHHDDLETIRQCHESIVRTGEGTCLHRFLIKGEQWIWLKTRYFIAYHQWNSKPEFIVAIHTDVVHTGESNRIKTSETVKTTDSKVRFQEKLRIKHEELSRKISEQQDELRMISEQLFGYRDVKNE